MFFVLAAPLEGTLDAGRALATLATERSQGFIDAEPYNTRTWNGVWVIPHLHVDGRGSSTECERANVGGGLRRQLQRRRGSGSIRSGAPGSTWCGAPRATREQKSLLQPPRASSSFDLISCFANY